MVVAVLSVFLAFLLVSIEHEFKASTLYETSVATARASPELLGMLGTPIDVMVRFGANLAIHQWRRESYVDDSAEGA